MGLSGTNRRAWRRSVRAGVKPGAVGRGQIDLQQFCAASEMKLAAERGQGLAMLQEVVQVIAGASAQFQGLLESSGDGLAAIAFDE